MNDVEVPLGEPITDNEIESMFSFNEYVVSTLSKLRCALTFPELLFSNNIIALWKYWELNFQYNGFRIFIKSLYYIKEAIRMKQWSQETEMKLTFYRTELACENILSIQWTFVINRQDFRVFYLAILDWLYQNKKNSLAINWIA